MSLQGQKQASAECSVSEEATSDREMYATTNERIRRSESTVLLLAFKANVREGNEGNVSHREDYSTIDLLPAL